MPVRQTKRHRVKVTVGRAFVQNKLYIRQSISEPTLGSHAKCQFMGGMEIEPMCMEPTIAGYSYCPEHQRICYIKR